MYNQMIEATVETQAKIIIAVMEAMNTEEIKYWFSSACEVCC